MAEAAGGEASSAGWKWLWTWRSLMPLALLPLGPGPQPGNGCCGGCCWMVAATGPASPQQPEAWQPRQRNGEKTDNPRSGCLLRRPPEPGPGGVRRQEKGREQLSGVPSPGNGDRRLRPPPRSRGRRRRFSPPLQEREVQPPSLRRLPPEPTASTVSLRSCSEAARLEQTTRRRGPPPLPLPPPPPGRLPEGAAPAAAHRR